MPEPNTRGVSVESREDRLRYALIAVAGLTALALLWLLLGWAGSMSAQDLNLSILLQIVLVAAAAVLMAIAAVGLLGSHAWGASLIAWVAFGIAPFLALGILVAFASSVLPSSYNTATGGVDPEDVIIGLAFPAALITGWLATRLGRSLRGPSGQ